MNRVFILKLFKFMYYYLLKNQDGDCSTEKLLTGLFAFVQAGASPWTCGIHLFEACPGA